MSREATLKTQLAAPASPQSYNGRYLVAGSAMPWLWTANALNRAFPYGLQDGTGPTVLTLSGLRAKPGQKLKIQYLSGAVTVGPGWPPTDANGDGDQRQFAYGGRGSTDRYLAAQYVGPYPVPAGELLGAFTNRLGQLVYHPFAIGDGPAVIPIPPGAINLQLGTNDDLYADNTGAFTVSVTAQP